MVQQQRRTEHLYMALIYLERNQDPFVLLIHVKFGRQHKQQSYNQHFSRSVNDFQHRHHFHFPSSSGVPQQVIP